MGALRSAETSVNFHETHSRRQQPFDIPDLGGYLYAWFETISTSSTPACCLLVNAPILNNEHSKTTATLCTTTRQTTKRHFSQLRLWSRMTAVRCPYKAAGWQHYKQIFLQIDNPCKIANRITVMDSSDENGAALSTKLTVDDVDVEFLPLIYEIIRRYEARWKSVYRPYFCCLWTARLPIGTTIVFIDPCVLD